MLKAFTRRGYVKLDNDAAALKIAIEYLKQPKREREQRGENDHPTAGHSGSSSAGLDGSN